MPGEISRSQQDEYSIILQADSGQPTPSETPWAARWDYTAEMGFLKLFLSYKGKGTHNQTETAKSI